MHFVAKLVKSFGRQGDAAKSLDDFRYTNACLLPYNVGIKTVFCNGQIIGSAHGQITRWSLAPRVCQSRRSVRVRANHRGL